MNLACQHRDLLLSRLASWLDVVVVDELSYQVGFVAHIYPSLLMSRCFVPPAEFWHNRTTIQRVLSLNRMWPILLRDSRRRDKQQVAPSWPSGFLGPGVI